MSGQIPCAMSQMWVYGREAAFAPNLPATVPAKVVFDAAYIKKKEAHHLATAHLPAIQHEHGAWLSITMSHHLVTTGVKWPRLPLPDARLLQNPVGFIALISFIASDLVPKCSQTWKMHASVRAQGSASSIHRSMNEASCFCKSKS